MPAALPPVRPAHIKPTKKMKKKPADITSESTQMKGVVAIEKVSSKARSFLTNILQKSV